MPTNKKQKSKEILQIAAQLFARNGFERTATRDISRAAGISHGALYYYFDSKEHLLYQILDETLSDGLRLIRGIERSRKSLREKLSAITVLYTRYFSFDINRMKLLADEQKSLNPFHKRKIDKKQTTFLDVVVRILNGLKAQGEMVDLDTTVCAFAFFGMVHWIHRWYDPNKRIKQDQLSEIFTRIFTQGIYREKKARGLT